MLEQVPDAMNKGLVGAACAVVLVLTAVVATRQGQARPDYQLAYVDHEGRRTIVGRVPGLDVRTADFTRRHARDVRYAG